MRVDICLRCRHVQSRSQKSFGSAGGPILAGLLPGTYRNRPSGRPKAGRRADFNAFPVAVRPKSGPEGRFTARKHYCVTSSKIQRTSGCRPRGPSDLIFQIRGRKSWIWPRFLGGMGPLRPQNPPFPAPDPKNEILGRTYVGMLDCFLGGSNRKSSRNGLGIDLPG